MFGSGEPRHGHARSGGRQVSARGRGAPGFMGPIGVEGPGESISPRLWPVEVDGVLHLVRSDGAVFWLRGAREASSCEDHRGRVHHVPARPAKWVSLPPVPGTAADLERLAAEEQDL